MQAYIEHCEDYYLGKRITNKMHGINHKCKVLLDHLDDTNSLTPNACVHADEAHVAQLIYMLILHIQIFFFTSLGGDARTSKSCDI